MNPFDQFKQLTQLNEQMRTMFGSEYFRNLMKNMPMGELDQSQNMDLQKMMSSEMFRGADITQHFPRVDIYQTRHEVVAIVEVPGLEAASDVDLHIKADSLTISGRSSSRYSTISEDRYHLTERFRGAFERTVSLPARVRPSQARATYRGGLLEVRMTKDSRPGGRGRSGHHVPITFG